MSTGNVLKVHCGDGSARGAGLRSAIISASFLLAVSLAVSVVGPGETARAQPVPPSLVLPGDISVETTESAGAVVSYEPSATDWQGRSVTVTCDPESGSLFPLGVSTVTCIATDQRGSTTTGSFTVSVLAPPAPAPDPAPDPSPEPPPEEPPPESDPAPGLPPPPIPIAPPQPDPAEPVDVTAPPAIGGLVARAGDHRVRLRWTASSVPDLEDYVLTRTKGQVDPESISPEIVVYVGSETRFMDGKLKNRQEYTYRVFAVDRSGNISAGAVVSAIPAAKLLARPKDKTQLRAFARPRFRWAPVRRATYFNLQLYRGTKKVLSVWPNRAQLKLPARWKFEGRTYRLRPGRYTWYVFPGYGEKSERNYGPVLGRGTFHGHRPGEPAS